MKIKQFNFFTIIDIFVLL